MFNHEKIKRIYGDYVNENGQPPNDKLFIFSEDDSDIVNLNLEKWQLEEVESFKKGDVINIGTAPMPKYDAETISEVWSNMMNFNKMK